MLRFIHEMNWVKSFNGTLDCVSKNDTALACYNFDEHQTILTIFGRNVAKKVSNQMVLYFLTSRN